MRLYKVVSRLLCSWKAEVYIDKIYNTGALKEIITNCEDVTPPFAKQTIKKNSFALRCFVISAANLKPKVKINLSLDTQYIHYISKYMDTWTLHPYLIVENKKDQSRLWKTARGQMYVDSGVHTHIKWILGNDYFLHF